MLVCLLCVMSMSAAFMACTSAEELVHVTAWMLAPLNRAGVKTDAFVLALNVAFRFVPVLADEFAQLKRAQQARLGGFDGSVRKRLSAYTRLFAPLVQSAFRRADSLAAGFYSRCFACGRARTNRSTWALKARDVLSIVLAAALVVVTFAV